MSRPRPFPVSIRSKSFRPLPEQTPLTARESLAPLRSARNRRSLLPSAPLDTGPRITLDSIALTLPVPPSINHQYATVNGRRLLSAKGRAYKELVGQQILVALAQSPHRGTLRHHLQEAYLSLSIHFFFASALRRDTDGGLKIAQDALCEGLGLNDNRVVETHLYKHQDRDNPRMEILLSAARSAGPGSSCRTELTAPPTVLPEPPSDSRRNR